MTAQLGSSRDPIDYAIFTVQSLLTARQTCAVRERNGLPPLPAWPEFTDEVVARKIVGFLLDAGWTAPVTAAGAAS